MITDGYRIGDRYDIDFELDENHMHILINGVTLAHLNVQKDGLLVRLYDSTIPDCHGYVHKHKHRDNINECPNCNDYLLTLQIPAFLHYDIQNDGSAIKFDNETLWEDDCLLYCDNCGIDSAQFDAELGYKKLAFDFDRKTKKLTAVGIIKKGEY